ncbi:MAG: hypothetical protein EPO35_03210 [Acidobacteria bacterium]|nr:MAG: hypothetical protein EPO35_03210 [Acidobacteriota bacterium]
MPRGLPLATSALLSLLLVQGCSGAKAQVMLPDPNPLNIPQAPARVVVPPAPEPPPVVTEATPPAASTTTQNPPANTTRSNRETRPATPPPANPPAATPPPTVPPAPTTTPLETQANQSELEQRARGLLASANAALDKIDYKALSLDGKTQFDTAKRFTKQADEALKAKNIVYAWQLADKANTIATLLLRHA